jgi:hypothetical protein
MSTVAGTATLNAAAKPRKEKALRREISSKLYLSLMATSCPLGGLFGDLIYPKAEVAPEDDCLPIGLGDNVRFGLLADIPTNVAPSFSSVAKTENPSAIAIVMVQMVIHIDVTSLGHNVSRCADRSGHAPKRYTMMVSRDFTGVFIWRFVGV